MCQEKRKAKKSRKRKERKEGVDVMYDEVNDEVDGRRRRREMNGVRSINACETMEGSKNEANKGREATHIQQGSKRQR